MIEQIEELVGSGRYFEAHNRAKEYCQQYPDSLRAKQLCGLAMSKSGARNAAIKFLEPVLADSEDDAETAGILGGVYKEQFRMTADSSFARKSLDTYLSNFEKTRNSYTGINAATMSQILGQGKNARMIAEDVIDISKDSDTFWSYATIGEALLLLRKSSEAYEYYLKAAQLGGGQYGKLGSIYAQLLILKHYINVPENILALFSPPKVAIFAGHMIDHNRPAARFPDSISEQIKFAIANELRINNIKIGYSSLACGSDILFVESILELGGEAKVFLPFDRDDFIKTSVEFAGELWIERFRKIEESNQLTFISRRNYDNSDLLFHFLGKVMMGNGIIRATSLKDKPFLLTVASESDNEKKSGGTNDIRSIWPYQSNAININPDLYLNPVDRVATQNISQDKPETKQPVVSSNAIRYFVFGTLVDNGNEEANNLLREIEGLVAREFTDFPGPRYSGASENGIFALYTKAHYAMDFSLRLMNWCESRNVEVRIALEAVLMQKNSNPKTVIEETSSLKSLAFTDACYATMQFASALSAEQPGRYDFHHVGVIEEGMIDGGQEIYKIDKKVETALS